MTHYRKFIDQDGKEVIAEPMCIIAASECLAHEATPERIKYQFSILFHEIQEGIPHNVDEVIIRRYQGMQKGMGTYLIKLEARYYEPKIRY